MNNTLDIIQDSEKVARLIDNEWVVNEFLSTCADACKRHQTYCN